MAAPAGFEIQITAKRPLAVMTSRTRVISAGEVFESPGRANLSLLRQPCGVVVAIAASQTLPPAVFDVTERPAERGCIV